MEKEIRIGFRATERERIFTKAVGKRITHNLALAKQYPSYKEILEDEGKISKEEGER